METVPLAMFADQDKVSVGLFRLIQFLVEATCIRSNFLGPNVPLGMFGHQVGLGQSRTVSKSSAV